MYTLQSMHNFDTFWFWFVRFSYYEYDYISTLMANVNISRISNHEYL